MKKHEKKELRKILKRIRKELRLRISENEGNPIRCFDYSLCVIADHVTYTWDNLDLFKKHLESCFGYDHQYYNWNNKPMKWVRFPNGIPGTSTSRGEMLYWKTFDYQSRLDWLNQEIKKLKS